MRRASQPVTPGRRAAAGVRRETRAARAAELSALLAVTATVAAAAADADAPDDEDADAAERDAAAAADALARGVAERDFLPLLLQSTMSALTSRRAAHLLLLLLVAAHGVTRVGAAGMGAGVRAPKASSRRGSASAGVPPAPGATDAAMPPAMLFVTLHGDKGAAGDADNALRRFRLTGGRTSYGRAKLRVDALPPLALTNEGDAPSDGAAKAGKRALLYPRAMALLRGGAAGGGDALLVASAAGDGGGAVRAAAAAAACAAGGGLLSAPPPPPPPSPPPPSKGGPAAVKVAAAAAAPKTPRVASTVFCADGLDHPYGVSVAADGRVIVSNQGSGVVSVCTAKDGVATFFARHGSGRGADTDADADVADADADATPPRLSRAATPTSAASARAGDADSPLRGVAVSPATGAVFVAAKDYNTVFVHAPNGTQTAAIPVDSPIALLFDPARDGLFIGSASRSAVRVVFWDAKSGQMRGRFEHRDGKGHAAGMALHGGALLVLGQGAGAVYQFDVATGDMVGTLVSGLARPEALQLYAGPC